MAFRADASSSIGIGHISRCLVLAEALKKRGIHSVFLSRRLPGNSGRIVRERGFPLLWISRDDRNQKRAFRWQDAVRTIKLVLHHGCSCLIVDHYGLGFGWERHVARQTGIPLVILEDLPVRRHFGSVLVDPSAGRTPWEYRRKTPQGCRLLLGPKYALVPPKFVFGGREKGGRVPNQVLISMGGMDHQNATMKILSALDKIPEAKKLRLQVALGREAPWRPHVKRALSRFPWRKSTMVKSPDMALLMRRSQAGILAPGTTAWEALGAGLPSIFLATAPHQVANARRLHRGGYARYLGLASGITSLPLREELYRLLTSKAVCRRLSHRGKSLVDGQGPQRIAREIVAIAKKNLNHA